MGVIRAMGKAGQSLVDASRFQIFHRPAVGPRGLACWVALPEVPGPQAPLVAVHGISRNALEMVRLLAPLCQRTGRAVIVPCFDGQGWKNYQQVVKPKRADLASIKRENHDGYHSSRQRPAQRNWLAEQRQVGIQHPAGLARGGTFRVE